MKPLTEEQQKLVEENLEWADAVSAKYHKSKRLSRDLLDDIICEGRVGLVKAARRWDKENGSKFHVYAYFYVIGEIIDKSRALHGTARRHSRPKNDLANAIHTPFDDEHLIADQHTFEAIDDHICAERLIQIAREKFHEDKVRALKMWMNGKHHTIISKECLRGTSKQNFFYILRTILDHIKEIVDKRDRRLSKIVGRD